MVAGQRRPVIYALQQVEVLLESAHAVNAPMFFDSVTIATTIVHHRVNKGFAGFFGRSWHDVPLGGSYTRLAPLRKRGGTARRSAAAFFSSSWLQSHVDSQSTRFTTSNTLCAA